MERTRRAVTVAMAIGNSGAASGSVVASIEAADVDVVEITLDGSVQNPPSLPTEPNCSSRCGVVATTSVPPIWSSSRSTDPSHGN